MVDLRPGEPAANFITLTEAAISDGDVPFTLVTAWTDGGDVPRIAYRSQETTADDVWEEAADFVQLLVAVYQLDATLVHDSAPAQVVGVTLPQMESDMDAGTGWLLRRTWVDQFSDGTLSAEELFRLINETRFQVRERAVLTAADEEDSVQLPEDVRTDPE